jgi:hypothetical protein
MWFDLKKKMRVLKIEWFGERERDLLLLFPDEIPGDLPEKLVGEYVCVWERERGNVVMGNGKRGESR